MYSKLMYTLLSGFRFLVLVLVKLVSKVFFTVKVDWVGETPSSPFRGVRLAVLLNHTSLFEPIFLAPLPLHILWRMASSGAFPGADITLDRPLAGAFFKLLSPHVISITRRRDKSWDRFLDVIGSDTLILIAAEGRMKRPSGLDKHGRPMTVRGGIADLLQLVGTGKMVIAYSHGLHHIHTPGQRFPNLFRTAQITLEEVDIETYCKRIQATASTKSFKAAVIEDLERRRNRFCPPQAMAR